MEDNAKVNMAVQVALQNTDFISVGSLLSKGFSGLYGYPVFNLLRSLCIIFHEYYLKFYFSPQTGQYLFIFGNIQVNGIK